MTGVAAPAPARVRAYVGLGSNLDDPAGQVRRALSALRALAGTRVAAASPLYRSPPLGPPDQPDYVNAVASLDTALGARALLGELQAIEAAQGRARGGERWGPRTLDLDLLLYGDARIEEGGLVVPHPRAHERAFVLVPLHDLAPALYIPGRGSIRQLLRRVPAAGLERVEGSAGSDPEA